jgi:microcystin degradation protein MlrC
MCPFMACLGTETNSISPIPTGMPAFEPTMLRHGDGAAAGAGYVVVESPSSCARCSSAGSGARSAPCIGIR